MSKDSLIKRILIAMLIILSWALVWGITQWLCSVSYQLSAKFGLFIWLLLGVALFSLLLALSVPYKEQNNAEGNNPYGYCNISYWYSIIRRFIPITRNQSKAHEKSTNNNNDTYNHKDNCPVIHKPAFHNLNPTDAISKYLLSTYSIFRRLCSWGIPVIFPFWRKKYLVTLSTSPSSEEMKPMSLMYSHTMAARALRYIYVVFASIWHRLIIWRDTYDGNQK
jgi:hypothetical protein